MFCFSYCSFRLQLKRRSVGHLKVPGRTQCHPVKRFFPKLKTRPTNKHHTVIKSSYFSLLSLQYTRCPAEVTLAPLTVRLRSKVPHYYLLNRPCWPTDKLLPAFSWFPSLVCVITHLKKKCFFFTFNFVLVYFLSVVFFVFFLTL